MKAPPDQTPLYAPGWPGIAPRWTSSVKNGVGTALGAASKVWFTLSHGILDEIYFPRVDSACTRDLGLIVTDGASYFSEEKRDYAGALKAAAGGLSWTVSRGSTRYPSDCSVPGCTPGAIVLPSRFAGDPAITLQLAAPGTLYQPRWNQLDFSMGRTFKFSGKSVRAQVTLFNALNANPVLTETTSLGSNVSIAPYLSSDPNTGGTPISILQPRLIQLGAQIRF